MDENSQYIGRFAPTPSGSLHLGSITAALGSYMEARTRQGKWLVRIEDIDLPRVKKGSASSILHDLELLGLEWDSEIIYQRHRIEVYENVLEDLNSRGLLYRCACSRKMTKGKRYPGTCRNKAVNADRQHSLRLITGDQTICLEDSLQGRFSRNIQHESGDFILRRSDGLIAYHLAVVIDDAWQNVSHVVRGADLLDTTPHQVYLQHVLGLPTPVYCHLPLLVGTDNKKLSKSSNATRALLKNKPAQLLVDSLRILGQAPDDSLADSQPVEVIQWSLLNWNISKVPAIHQKISNEM